MTESVAVATALSDFAATLRYEEIPASVVAVVKACLLDCLGVALAASSIDESSGILYRALSQEAGSSVVFGYGTRVSPTIAALVNGALIHALNYDPIGENAGHLGVACLAAPFALGEMVGATGKDLITSAVVACEVSARITAAIVAAGRRPSEKFLSGQLLSYFGAAAGAARMLALDGAAMHSALGLALMQMSGSRQLSLAAGAPAKSIYGAFPSHGAVLSAMLAKGGMDARCDIFGEPAGLFSAIYGGGIDTSGIASDLKRTYRLVDVEIKPWPSSNQTFLHIEAALDARRQLGDRHDIVSIEVLADRKVANWCEPFSSKCSPPNAAAAANSIPFCIASALARGVFYLDSFYDVRNEMSLTCRLLERMRYTQADSPGVACIIIRMANGDEVRSRAITQPTGSRINEATLLTKFIDCSSRSVRPLGAANQQDIASMFLNLENVAAVSDIANLLAAEC